MVFPRFIPNLAFWLGIGFSLLWSTALSDIPTVQKLDLKTQDFLMKIVPPPVFPPEVLLVKLHQRDLKNPQLLEDPNFYVNLVNRLLEEGATTIILNLRAIWVQTADHVNHPIKDLIRNHCDRLVLVVPTTRVSLANPTTWMPYHYFIPLDSHGQLLFPINRVLGFSEYEPEEHDPSVLSSPARQAYLVGNFIFSSNLNEEQKLDAAVWLALKKFQSHQENSKLPIKNNQTTPIQVHFWPKEIRLPNLDVGEIIQGSHSLKQVDNKIVLVGFADIDDPNSFSIHSPFGHEISNVEFQANLLGNLLTNSFYRVAPQWLSELMIVGGGVLISEVIVGMMLQQPSRRSKRYYKLVLIIVGNLCLLSVIGF